MDKKLLIVELPLDSNGDMKFPHEMIVNFMKMLNNQLPDTHYAIAMPFKDMYLIDKNGNYEIETVPEANFEKLCNLLKVDDSSG